MFTAANVTAFLCNQTGVDVVVNNASVVAQEIATATATAIANTTGNCYAREIPPPPRHCLRWCF